jgi:hypothetical protein
MSMSTARAARREDMLSLVFVVLLLEILSHSMDQDAVGTKRKLLPSRYSQRPPLSKSLVCS